MRKLIVVAKFSPRESTDSAQGGRLNSIFLSQIGDLADDICTMVEPGKKDASLPEIPDLH
jgi:hypothetical protein